MSTATCRTCSRCKSSKPCADFPVKKDRTSGVASQCKRCRSEVQAAARAARASALENSLPKEGWADIPGYEGFYQASRRGMVRAIAHRRMLGRASAGTTTRLGYMVVGLTKDGKRTRQYVHCLIALTFLGPKPDGMEVNHKDGVKVNNAIENLEYTTRSGNVQHAYDTGLMRPNPAKITREQALVARQMNADGASRAEISKHLGLGKTATRAAILGITWRA